MAYKYQAKNGSCIEVVNMMAGSKELSKPMVDELDEVYRKAKAFDEVKKHVDEEGDSYMDLYRQTKDPIFSLLNSNYDGLLGFIEELEDE